MSQKTSFGPVWFNSLIFLTFFLCVTHSSRRRRPWSCLRTATQKVETTESPLNRTNSYGILLFYQSRVASGSRTMQQNRNERVAGEQKKVRTSHPSRLAVRTSGGRKTRAHSSSETPGMWVVHYFNVKPTIFSRSPTPALFPFAHLLESTPAMSPFGARCVPSSATGKNDPLMMIYKCALYSFSFAGRYREIYVFAFVLVQLHSIYGVALVMHFY